ncbi:TPA: endonuclease III [Candidatus Dependentiae bacterium]|nr:MAG: Endonuclease III [candidate division TM6 bacterium GW2011_GWF2_36_131]KKQ02626.1 MAG: Endonuclease III [candidate division TM6 bacterium GW2011_GWE2_36_25]KKQ19240.1 MAG: Endonuclease III [candidate division TM6 bacterium GW2011_GWA2_36_9]HBR70257.1 endonuclease III [Candidatus Dependentiae bacterium]HCU00971.1 endonuclease III [Candidatus Dependentiae bacterium]
MRKCDLAIKKKKIIEVFRILRKATQGLPEPMSVVIAQEYQKDPFLILVSCLLSLRAKDVKTLPVARKLFSVAKTPADFVKMPLSELEKVIYSIGFFKQKAQTIRSVSKELIERFHGMVPKTRQELMSIKGIGPKTANLVLGMAYGIPAICVDVHVHRLSNRLGFVKTRTPLETEHSLEEILPKEYWIEYNHVLVKLGQNLSKTVPHLPDFIQQALKPLRFKTIKL